MHRWIRHRSIQLSQLFDGYLNELSTARDETEFINESRDDDLQRYWEDLDAPKVASDVVEAVLGAVFVDSELSTMAVWRVLVRIWLPWIDKYIKTTVVKPTLGQSRIRQ